MFKWLKVWQQARRLSSDEEAVRKDAVRVLADLGAVRALIAALGNRNALVRQIAAEALGELGDPRAVEPLIKALGCTHEGVRKSAAKALKCLGQVKWEALIQGNREDFARVAASGDPRAFEILGWALGNGDQWIGRCDAAEAIQWIGRCDAAEAMGKLGDPRAVERLIGALRDTNVHVRRSVAMALGGVGDPRALEALIKASGDADDLVRHFAIEALGKLGGPRAVEVLLKTLSGTETHLHATAALELARMGDRRAIEPLIVALGDVVHVRKQAAVALTGLGEVKWEPLVRGEDGDFARLGESGDPRAIRPLTMALGNKDPDFRKEVAKALAELGETQWESLIRGDGDDFTRLATSGDPRVFEPLLEALKSGSYLAAEALGTLGDRRAVEPLIEALDHRHEAVRIGAVQALGKSGDARAVEPLVKALRDAVHRVRWAAAQGLCDLLTGPSAPAISVSHWHNIHESIKAIPTHRDEGGKHLDQTDYKTCNHEDYPRHNHHDERTDFTYLTFPAEPPSAPVNQPPPTTQAIRCLEVTCPQCKKEYHLHPKNAGKRGKCSGCGGVFDIPALPQTGSAGTGARDF